MALFITDLLSGCASPTKRKSTNIMADGCRLLPAVGAPHQTTIVCFCSKENKCNSDIFKIVEMFPNEQTTAIIFTLQQHYLDFRRRRVGFGKQQNKQKAFFLRNAFDIVANKPIKRRDVSREPIWSEKLQYKRGFTRSSHTIPENIYKMASSRVSNVVHGDPGPFIPSK